MNTSKRREKKEQQQEQQQNYTTISISPEVHKKAKIYIAQEELTMKKFIESLILGKIEEKK